MTAHFYTIDQYESLINRVQAIETYLAQNFNVLKNAMNNLKSKQFLFSCKYQIIFEQRKN